MSSQDSTSPLAQTSGQRRVWLRREGFGLLALVLLLLGIVGPISTVLLWSFAEQWRYPAIVPTRWGVSYWAETLGRADIRKALPTSIVTTLLVTALSALICFPAAYAFARLRFRGRQVLLLSYLITNALPRFGLYVSIAVTFFRLNLVGTLPGVVLIQLLNTLLLMIWIPTSAFQGVDRALEEAALDVGASRLRVFVQITLPQVYPALAAALMLTLVGTFYETYGALLIGVPNVLTIPVIMFPLINNQPIPQYGAILSLILFAPSTLLIIFANRLLRGGYLTAGLGV
ncbi:MAG: carbohydrate ABC transporter permease [Chloroflexales bacterium]|nr:carbohydrate ABC transporter permease [Chloroflexales bacterium]